MIFRSKMEYKKPMVTIELQEYEDLKAVDVTAYQKAFNLLFKRLAKSDPRTMQDFSDDFKEAKLKIHVDEKGLMTIENVKD